MSDHKMYRRIIDAYRMKLMEVNQKACDEVDDWMWADKTTRWVVNTAEVDPGRLMTAKEIAEQFGLKVHNIRAWARRHPDKIPTYKEGNRVLFRLRDVLNIVH